MNYAETHHSTGPQGQPTMHKVTAAFVLALGCCMVAVGRALGIEQPDLVDSALGSLGVVGLIAFGACLGLLGFALLVLSDDDPTH